MDPRALPPEVAAEARRRGLDEHDMADRWQRSPWRERMRMRHIFAPTPATRVYDAATTVLYLAGLVAAAVVLLNLAAALPPQSVQEDRAELRDSGYADVLLERP